MFCVQYVNVHTQICAHRQEFSMWCWITEWNMMQRCLSISVALTGLSCMCLSISCEVVLKFNQNDSISQHLFQVVTGFHCFLILQPTVSINPIIVPCSADIFSLTGPIICSHNESIMNVECVLWLIFLGDSAGRMNNDSVLHHHCC